MSRIFFGKKDHSKCFLNSRHLVKSRSSSQKLWFFKKFGPCSSISSFFFFFMCLLSLHNAYFSLDRVEICTELPKNPEDNLQEFLGCSVHFNPIQWKINNWGGPECTHKESQKMIEFSSGGQSSLTDRVFGVKLHAFAITDEFNRGFHIIFSRKSISWSWSRYGMTQHQRASLLCVVWLLCELKHKEWLSVNKGEMRLKALLALLMLTWVSTIIFTQTNQTQDRKCLIELRHLVNLP